MAARQVELCAPLCFLFCKFGKVQVSTLKSVLSDNYTSTELADAKNVLFNGLNEIQPAEKIPHCTKQRRNSANRHSHEVNDLLTLISYIDENKLVDRLPVYAVSDVDKIPSIRMYDGDLKVLTNRLNKLEERMESLGVLPNKMAAMSAELVKLQQVCSVSRSSYSGVASGTGVQPDTAQPTCKLGRSHDSGSAIHGSATAPNTTVATSTDGSVSAGINSLQTGISHRNGSASLADPSDSQMLWSSTQVELEAGANIETALLDTETDGYTVVRGRRAAKRARRETQSPATGGGRSVPVPIAARDNKGKRLMVGTKTNSGHICAAEVSRRKSVFCVDNVHPSVTPEDMRTFLDWTIGIDVVSLHPVAPRRRRNIKNTNRVAFRLCVFADQTARVLNPEKWPENVVISEWYFKQKEPGVSDTRRRSEADYGDADVRHHNQPNLGMSEVERERIRATTAKFLASIRVEESSLAESGACSIGESGASSVFADEHESAPTVVTESALPIESIELPSNLETIDLGSIETAAVGSDTTLTENGGSD
jgi:hypothetical protein